MRTAMTRLAVVAALALLAGQGRAQEAAPGPGEDPRAPRFADVERGFFIGMEAGWPVLLSKTPTKDPVKFPFATGGGGTAGGSATGSSVTTSIRVRAETLRSRRTASKRQAAMPCRAR